MSAGTPPAIIQGGMGIGVSDWRLARAVSRCGQMGVVSGTAIDNVLVRRLQAGDPGGHMRRAMEKFPLPRVAARILRRYFKPGGRSPGEPFSLLPMHQAVLDRARQQVTMLASFVEVHLAKDGHQGPVGINLLTKVQMPNLASLFGAMLAGVDYVLMGAGIPREIPAALDALAENRTATLRLDLAGASAERPESLTLDPLEHFDQRPPALRRPRFLPIIASNSLASLLARKGAGGIDGLIIEGPTAGGHNAPPRGEARFDDRGQPLYGERDTVDVPKIRELGLPFWLAGGRGCPTRTRVALEAGAAGVQVGTLFAFCEESGIAEPLKRSVLEHAARGEVRVHTDPQASPTGFPFKLVQWAGDPGRERERERVCDLGYLRTPFRRADGGIGYRCASEPVGQFVAKGGEAKQTEGRRCLCNALFANIGLGQPRPGGGDEPPLLTSGDDLPSIGTFLAGRTRYTAADVVRYLLGEALVPATGT